MLDKTCLYHRALPHKHSNPLISFANQQLAPTDSQFILNGNTPSGANVWLLANAPAWPDQHLTESNHLHQLIFLRPKYQSVTGTDNCCVFKMTSLWVRASILLFFLKAETKLEESNCLFWSHVWYFAFHLANLTYKMVMQKLAQGIDQFFTALLTSFLQFHCFIDHCMIRKLI